MTAIREAGRIADDDPINVNLLAMGFKRARKTEMKRLPVNRWTMRQGNVGLILKPNWRGKYVVTIFYVDHHSSQVVTRRVSEAAFDDPYSLAAYLSLEGDGDAIAAAKRLCTIERRGEIP